MNKNKKTSLNKKIIKSIAAFAAVLVIATGALVCVQYYYSQVRNYSNQAFGFARTAATFIDGDRVLEFVETEEKDDYYYEILDFLTTTGYMERKRYSNIERLITYAEELRERMM